MKTILFTLALTAGCQLSFQAQNSPTSFSCSGESSDSAEILAQNALSLDPAMASSALVKLRALGPAGLDILLQVHAKDVAQAISRGGQSTVAAGGASCQPLTTSTKNDWQRLKAAIDSVSGQCDAYASGLYWYTDFEQAKAAAKGAGKPILSLRLLGKLNEDYSCANSRFFRTTLYANSDVSKYLREHFILHWQSVRPVPRLTIDFGDGRKIERTITGNSAHYVLDQNGDAVDAIPGLYGPKAFLKALSQAEGAALAFARSTREDRLNVLRQYHVSCRAATGRQLQADLATLALANVVLVTGPGIDTNVVPTARVAGRLAVSKSAVESPVLKLLQPKGGSGPAPTRGSLDDATWTRLAELHAEDAKLDATSRSVVVSKNPKAFEASQLTMSKRLIEDPVLVTLRNLERSISEDSVRNEYLLHTQIHDWFVQGIAPTELRTLNAKVYAELFLMPENDPWLGLAPKETFTGLPQEGLALVVGR